MVLEPYATHLAGTDLQGESFQLQSPKCKSKLEHVRAIIVVLGLR